MNKLFKISIIIFSFLIPIALSIIIPSFFTFTWIPLIVVLIIEFIIGIILGIILIIVKFSKKVKIPEEIDTKTAEAKAINESLIDESDPDNFLIIDKLLYKIGEKGITEKTPILILDGYGTETNKKRVALINLKIPDKEISWLKGDKCTEENIEKWAIRMAETQPTEEVERISTGYQFGMPTMTKETIRPTETKEEKEKQEVEEKNIL